MSLRIPLLSVNKTRKQDWISDEEDRSVVTHKIPVS